MKAVKLSLFTKQLSGGVDCEELSTSRSVLGPQTDFGALAKIHVQPVDNMCNLQAFSTRDTVDGNGVGRTVKNFTVLHIQIRWAQWPLDKSKDCLKHWAISHKTPQSTEAQLKCRWEAKPSPDEDHDRTGYIDVIGERHIRNEANILNIVYLGLILKYEIVPPTRNILFVFRYFPWCPGCHSSNKYRLAP